MEKKSLSRDGKNARKAKPPVKGGAEKDKGGGRFERKRNDRPVVKRGGDNDEKRPSRVRKSAADDKSVKPWKDRNKPEEKDRKPFTRDKSSNDRTEKPWKKREDVDDRKPYRKRNERGDDQREKPWKKKTDFREDSDQQRKPYREKGGEEDQKPLLKKRGEYAEDTSSGKWGRAYKGDVEKETSYERKKSYDKEGRNDKFDRGGQKDRKPRFDGSDKPRFNRDKDQKTWSGKKKSKDDGPVRLNKYIANSGLCSRREADVMIATGVVKVNGEVITTMGYKVSLIDKVTVDGREIKAERKIYLLLNKPKDVITTMSDPEDRGTVMDLIKDACRERVYPVGRLDRNTTGLILFTNDGDMAKKLMHPSHKVLKVYEATLDRNITREDMNAISAGVELDDGFVQVDAVAWPDPVKKNVVGIELHSGAYHVVKRIFEHFQYKVLRLDRTMYGPLTKKNLPRGKWRMLNEDEISILHRI